MTQHGHERVQLDHLLAEWPEAEVLPVHPRLHSSGGLEAHLRFDDHGRAQRSQLVAEGRIALVSDDTLQLAVQVGGPQHRADQQPTLDVPELRRRQRVLRGARRIRAWAVRRHLPGHRAAVDLEPPGESTDAPAVSM